MITIITIASVVILGIPLTLLGYFTLKAFALDIIHAIQWLARKLHPQHVNLDDTVSFNPVSPEPSTIDLSGLDEWCHRN